MTQVRTAMVLGGYGLIGAACVQALISDGFKVIGVGRSIAAGRRSNSQIEWLERDISAATEAEWTADMANVDVVVNAAGALQDGMRDNLANIHEVAIARMTAALEGSPARFIQISAAGVSEAASTEFFRSKMRGDRILMSSGLDWVVLRPTLVIGPQAYGGTALLRASAAIPFVGLMVLPDVEVQTVFIEDLAKAVVQAARGDIAGHTVADVTESGAQTLGDLVLGFRNWLGFSPWRTTLEVPSLLVAAISIGADVLGCFGWRSPLRSNAVKALAEGIRGNPQSLSSAGGAQCRSFAKTLNAMPSTAQERWFSRLYFLMPIGVATLALFWIISGLIGLISQDVARALLTDRGMSPVFAISSVFGGAILDIVLGVAALFRRWTRAACLAMMVVSIAYLVGGTFWTPDIWADPLGPFVKVLPGISLAAFVAAVLEER